MRRFAPHILAILLVIAAACGSSPMVRAQSPRTAPLPVKPVGRGLFRQNRQQNQDPQSPAEPRSPIPTTPPGKMQAAAPTEAHGDEDEVLKQAKRAIAINQLRYLDPSIGHSPWMIMHGLLALRNEYEIKIGNQKVNALDYVTKQNPSYVANLPDPTKPGSPIVRVQHHWFEATAYGARAQPYIVSFAFEGHTNQFLAILSMANLPLTHEFKVSDPQRPGNSKTVTMADMVRHAQLNVHVGNPNEVAWTLWFLANYLEPDAKWTDKNGQPWSMEQLVIVQTNAPLFNGTQDLAPCGGTHGLFALACACNSYQDKYGKLQGAWLAARQKLDNHIELARRMQNRDGSFSSDFFKATGYTPEMSKRFKSSGHMLEWLIMALPPERLSEQWVRSGVMSVANDQVRWGQAGLGTADTGAMYHALHALVLYRNRLEPPVSIKPPEQVAELLPEMKKPVPQPMPSTTAEKETKAPEPPPKTSANEPEATIRLINPPMNKLSPLGSVRPLLRPITNSKDTATKPAAPATSPPALAPTVPEPPPMSEQLGESDAPVLEKPTTTIKPRPAPSEPTAEGALVIPLTEAEGGTAAAPLFGDQPRSNPPATSKTPLPTRPAPGSLVPQMPEPTPSKAPSSSD